MVRAIIGTYRGHEKRLLNPERLPGGDGIRAGY